MNAVLRLLHEKFELAELNSILRANNIQRIEDLKFESLRMLISFANFILKDGVISEHEIHDFSILKRIFRIKEGDFIKFKNFEITEILKKEFIRIYSDKFVDKKEELMNLNLQSLFDLSYDEFENIKRDEIISALLQGANPIDLDIARIPKGFRI